MRKTVLLRLFFVLVLLTTALSLSTASAQPNIDPTAWYVIRNIGGNKVMDVSNNGCCNGAWIHIWTYGGLPNQQWRITPVSGGYYKIAARSTGRVLDVEGASTGDWVHIHQWDYEGLPNQEWAIVQVTQTTYYLVARHSGKRAVVAGSPTSNGTLVRQNGPGLPSVNYQWKLEIVP